MSLSDYLPSIVAVVAVGVGFLLARKGIQDVTKQEIRQQPLEQVLKTMGFKNAKFQDLNKLTPEAFAMLRQLFYDFYTYTKPPTSTTGMASTLAQLAELTKVMQPQQAAQPSKVETVSETGVKA